MCPNILPSLSNFPAAELYVNQRFHENNKIWASRESRRPLFRSGDKRESNYSFTIIFVLDPWLLDEANLI